MAIKFNRKQVVAAKKTISASDKGKLCITDAINGTTTGGAATGVELMTSLVVSLQNLGLTKKQIASAFQVSPQSVVLLDAKVRKTFTP